MTLKRIGLSLVLLVCASGWSADFVAGTAPHRRPVHAPVVTAHTVPTATLAAYMQGIENPVPLNVRQAVEAGAWFMPLRHAGMTGPYDLRGRHAPSANR